MKRPTLTQPFANTRELSKGGQSFTYVPAAEVVDRLNTVLGVGEWGFIVMDAFRDGDWVVVHGRLSACGGIFDQFGGQQIKYLSSGEKGRPVDLGDDYKGAASDALKKCAQMVGAGLYLSLGRAPHSAAKFDEERGGGEQQKEAGVLDDAEPQSGTATGEGDTGSSSPAALTPGFSGDRF